MDNVNEYTWVSGFQDGNNKQTNTNKEVVNGVIDIFRVDDRRFGASCVVVVGAEPLGVSTRNGVEVAGELVWNLSTATNKGLHAVTTEVNKSIFVELLPAKLAATEAKAELDILGETKRFQTDSVNVGNRHVEEGTTDMIKVLEVGGRSHAPAHTPKHTSTCASTRTPGTS
ncbi:hypothetical protein LSAT2_032195 [Lamellibrachia satsuma]|nr:hypothetical protein LSAT2_032195 [Lamellibrachia satsuma]